MSKALLKMTSVEPQAPKPEPETSIPPSPSSEPPPVPEIEPPDLDKPDIVPPVPTPPLHSRVAVS